MVVDVVVVVESTTNNNDNNNIIVVVVGAFTIFTATSRSLIGSVF